MLDRWYVATVALAILGCVLAAAVARELLSSRPLPPPPAPRSAQPAAPPIAAPAVARPAELAAYSVIPARNLFSPDRSERADAARAPTLPKPVLHGVVLNGDKSRAYLEDPIAKRVFSYAVGDAVAGGRLERIAADRVVIARPDGSIEVLLQDPAKPKPSTPAAAAGSPRPSGGATPVATPAPQPSVPVQTPKGGG